MTTTITESIIEDNTMTYRGYTGLAILSIDDLCLYGKLLDIRDVITYESNTVEGLIYEFERSVDEYIELNGPQMDDIINFKKFCIENVIHVNLDINNDTKKFQDPNTENLCYAYINKRKYEKLFKYLIDSLDSRE